MCHTVRNCRRHADPLPSLLTLFTDVDESQGHHAVFGYVAWQLRYRHRYRRHCFLRTYDADERPGQNEDSLHAEVCDRRGPVAWRAGTSGSLSLISRL